MQHSYVRLLLLSGLLAILAGAGFNFIVDPYGLFRWVERAGFNERKPKSGPHGELVKPYRVLEVRPRTLLLGNSRVEVGIDPESPHWPATLRPVFNMALPATGITASLRSLNHVMANGKPALVVVGLDFFDFIVHERPNAGRPAPPPEPSDFEKRLLVNADGSRNELYTIQRVKDHAAVLFSINALADSLQTVAMQRFEDQPDLTRLGFNPMHEYRRFVRVDGHDVLFRQVETTYLSSYLQARAAIYEPGTNSSPLLDRLRSLADRCRASGIRLVLYVHPYHAHMLESYRIAGLWPLFEEWKRALAGIVDGENRSDPRGPAVELWDFSGYNEISGEPVPAASEKGRGMRWYWEAGHYKREVGELVLARILGGPSEQRVVPSGFGVLLNKENVESHLAAIRVARAAYAQDRSKEIEGLQTLARGILARAARASHLPE